MNLNYKISEICFLLFTNIMILAPIFLFGIGKIFDKKKLYRRQI